MRRRFWPGLILGAAAVGYGCGDGSGTARSSKGPSGETALGAAPALRGTEMPAAGAAADFVLHDTEGRPYAFLAETAGSVAILFFGFTNCPDVCPVHMGNLAAVLRELPSDVSSQVEVVFVSVDPERDTPERVREWLDGFDRRFVGLVGEAEKVNEIQIALGLPPAVVRRDGNGIADVGHAAHVMVFSRERDRRWVYPFGTRQRDWTRDLPILVRGVPAAPGEES